MDVIVLGFYNNEDANLVEEIASKNDLRLVWNYQQFNICSEVGIKSLENYYKLYKTGILVDSDLPDDELFSSYSLINDITMDFVDKLWNKETSKNLKLFNFLDALNESTLEKIILAFADEWLEDSTAKIESMDFSRVKQRLNNLYVWCYEYKNLFKNDITRDDYHPLILELERKLN